MSCVVDLPSNAVSEDLAGSSKHINGTVGVAPIDLPASSLGAIISALVANPATNPSGAILLASFDGGAAYIDIARNAHIIWTPKGNQTQFKIKSSAGVINYQIIVNRKV